MRLRRHSPVFRLTHEQGGELVVIEAYLNKQDLGSELFDVIHEFRWGDPGRVILTPMRMIWACRRLLGCGGAI